MDITLSQIFFKIDFDASQSNFAIEFYDNLEYTQNLQNISFIIINIEQFDPNNKNETKIPMEFKIDIISNISSKYENI